MAMERRQEHERRRHPRYRPVAETAVRLREEGGRFETAARLRDISAGGCCMLVSQPPRGGVRLGVSLPLAAAAAADADFSCRLVSRIGEGDTWLVCVSFLDVPAEQREQLLQTLGSEAYRPVAADAGPGQRKHWRVDQWAAYLTAQDLPVMARSKTALSELEASAGAALCARDLADLAQADPFLCLCLLREAESRRSARLGHETTTPLAAVMQIGETGFKELLLGSPDTDDTNPGLAACEARVATAGRLAAGWSTARADVSPDELVMAALLSEIGELLLWHFAPELPQAALDALASGEARRSADAQELRCGFKFRDLTLKCAEIWRLPPIVIQLIRGTDSVRANIARVCINTSRHLAAAPDNPALPDDLVDAKLLIPGASMAWLLSWLVAVPAEERPALLETAEAALLKRQEALAEAARPQRKPG